MACRALEAGIETVLGALAIFAVPQFVEMLAEGGTIAQVAQIKDSVLGGVREVLKRPLSVLRGGVIGWLIGVMPALGTSAAGITAYLVEKKFSKEKEMFGKGSIDGLTAAEVGKGACVLGDGITSLMLGVPGSVTWAILMAALIIHGVQPGPRFMTSGVLPYTVFAGLLLGQVAYFVLGLLFVQQMSRIVYVPNQILAPVVAILCFVGAFVAKNYVYDIWIMVGLGAFAYVANRSGYPTVPMILGFILSTLIESNFHQAMGVGYGSATIFFQRPISLVLIIITAVFLAWPWLSVWIRDRFMKPEASALAPAAGGTETKLVRRRPRGRGQAGGQCRDLHERRGLCSVGCVLRDRHDLCSLGASVPRAGQRGGHGDRRLALHHHDPRPQDHPAQVLRHLRAVQGRHGLVGHHAAADRLCPGCAGVGMLVASVLWFGAVCYFSGYYRKPGAWQAIAITLVVVLVILYGAENLLRMDLPIGVFGI